MMHQSLLALAPMMATRSAPMTRTMPVVLNKPV
jgi:hypothetical protein